ncbi:MAG: putative rane-bound dolichyl-phosphate-mannose-protein mannosyltransferase [Bryobacterales bacterium]|nr:putative rane-bound dolichyl-phosphate-mannose-protein mannosyltransferase [Bryobacterales bacterium]
MTRISPQAVRWILITAIAAVAAIYVAAWLAPAIGLYHDDGVYLVTAKAIASGQGYVVNSLPTPVPQTKYPPLFPVLLALFTLVSGNPQWLKLLPLLCTAGWLFLSWRLLMRFGASGGSAALVVLLAAASPGTVFLGTNLMSEPLFALLTVAAMLALLNDRAALAGILAGLATLTRTAGIPLIAASALTLLLYGRFRRAVTFTGAAMLLVAPWFGWSLARATPQSYYGRAAYAAGNIITGLDANDKVLALLNNVMYLFASPWSMLTGIHDLWAALSTLAILIWSLWRRRQLVPDLFIGLYCLMLLFWLGPPQRFLTPVFPLVLWIFWRALRTIQRREAVTAIILILVAMVVRVDYKRLRMLPHGQFPSSDREPNDWREMDRLFAWIRTNTPPDAVIAGNLDPAIYLQTGRKAIRGFVPDFFKSFYLPGGATVAPDLLAAAIFAENASYVVLTPDRDFAESAAYHRSVQALERNGVIEPVAVPGLSSEYRLLRVIATGFRR